MRLWQEMSDLHVEFMEDPMEMLVDRVQVASDVLILAGDIAPLGSLHGRALEALRALCRLYQRVIWIPGNHEFYGATSWAWAQRAFRDLADLIPKVIPLNNAVATIDGIRVFGGTLWHRPTQSRERFGDHLYVPGFPVIQEGDGMAFRELLEGVEPGDVVLSHHLPHPGSVAPQFIGSPLNVYFLSNERRLIEERQPQLWIHGHTHTSCDYRAGATRVVCNPLGYYPDDINASFEWGKTVEIQ